MSHPVKIGLKWGILGVVVMFAMILVIENTGIGRPSLGVVAIAVIFELTGILAAREAFRKGKQFGREER